MYYVKATRRWGKLEQICSRESTKAVNANVFKRVLILHYDHNERGKNHPLTMDTNASTFLFWFLMVPVNSLIRFALWF